MDITISFYTQLGYCESKAEQMIKTYDRQTAEDIAFYRNLGYSLIQSEYLALNVFNIVDTFKAPANLAVPRGFDIGIKKAKCMSISPVQVNTSEAHTVNSVSLEEQVDECAELSEDDCDELLEESCDELLEEESFNGIACCDTMEPALSSEHLTDFFVVRKQYDVPINSVEKHNLMQDESRFKETIKSPTSTFRTTVNTANFGYIKNCILGYSENKIEKDAIRAEEIINYMDYEYSDFINVDTASMDNTDYMLIGIKSKQIEKPNSNIVLLVDVSGSMSLKASTLQKSIMTIAKQLGENDKISLVTYSGTDKVVFENLQGDNVTDLILSLSTINIAGCTNGSGGLDKAYEIALNNFIEKGNNRVVILTDGDFNFGTYNESELKLFIKEKKKSGVFLTVAGIKGVSAYNDRLMEALAREGNGNYFRLEDDNDILEVLNKKFLNNSIATAKDVKIQVEFNPAVVSRYKLIGFETRALSHEDFKNDKVEAETLGYNQSTTALYIIEYNKENQDIKSDLKYQKVVATGSDDICTVSVAYKDIDSSEQHEESKEVKRKDSKVINENMLKALMALKFIEYIQEPSNLDKYRTLGKIKNELSTSEKAKEMYNLAGILSKKNS